MKRICLYVDEKHLKKLTAIGKTKGLKLSQTVRLAMSDYIVKTERDSQR